MLESPGTRKQQSMITKIECKKGTKYDGLRRRRRRRGERVRGGGDGGRTEEREWRLQRCGLGGKRRR